MGLVKRWERICFLLLLFDMIWSPVGLAFSSLIVLLTLSKAAWKMSSRSVNVIRRELGVLFVVLFIFGGLFCAGDEFCFLVLFFFSIFIVSGLFRISIGARWSEVVVFHDGSGSS
jgi:hypothetical protein